MDAAGAPNQPLRARSGAVGCVLFLCMPPPLAGSVRALVVWVSVSPTCLSVCSRVVPSDSAQILCDSRYEVADIRFRDGTSTDSVPVSGSTSASFQATIPELLRKCIRLTVRFEVRVAQTAPLTALTRVGSGLDEASGVRGAGVGGSADTTHEILDMQLQPLSGQSPQVQLSALSLRVRGCDPHSYPSATRSAPAMQPSMHPHNGSHGPWLRWQ